MKRRKSPGKLEVEADPKRLPRVYWEAWAVHEAWRRLGFYADEIFAHYSEKQRTLFMVLKSQQKEFTLTVGKLRETEKSFTSKWTRLAEAVSAREVSEAFLHEVWEGSSVKRDSAGMTLMMSAKGFWFPRSLS